MTDRERFEAWAKGERFVYDFRPAALVGAYADPETQRAFNAWQASRRAALEEAAKVCEDVAKELLGPDTQESVFGAVMCRDEIRALATDDAARTGDSE